MTATIQTSRLLRHPVGRVWAMITDPAQVSRWLMPTTDLRAEPGAGFTMDAGAWGTIQCRVLEVEPQRLLRFSWSAGGLDTTVSWRLEPEGAHTRLVIEHGPFDLDDPRQRGAYEGLRGGWEGRVVERLEGLLDQL